MRKKLKKKKGSLIENIHSRIVALSFAVEDLKSELREFEYAVGLDEAKYKLAEIEKHLNTTGEYCMRLAHSCRKNPIPGKLKEALAILNLTSEKLEIQDLDAILQKNGHKPENPNFGFYLHDCRFLGVVEFDLLTKFYTLFAVRYYDHQKAQTIHKCSDDDFGVFARKMLRELGGKTYE